MFGLLNKVLDEPVRPLFSMDKLHLALCKRIDCGEQSGLPVSPLLGGRFDGRFVKRIGTVVAAPLVLSAIKQLQRSVVAHARCGSACLPDYDEAF